MVGVACQQQEGGGEDVMRRLLVATAGRSTAADAEQHYKDATEWGAVASQMQGADNVVETECAAWLSS